MVERANVRVLESVEALAEAAALDFASRARASVQERGAFRVALSGGSTPVRMFERLAKSAADASIPWSSIHWCWGDERPVPPTDEASNFRAAHDALLRHVPIEAANVHRIEGELAPALAAERYERELRRVFAEEREGVPRFDLLYLGLGPDGHVASLFPGSEALHEGSHLVVANWIEHLAMNRITITYPVINAARAVVLLVGGADKRDVLRRALVSDGTVPFLPVHGVHPSSGELLWLVDRSAAPQTS